MNNDNIKSKPYYNENIILSNELNIYFNNKYLHLEFNDIRCFKISIKRIKNILSIREDNDTVKYILENKKNICLNLEKENNYLMILNDTKIFGNNNITYPIKFKIREINNFLKIKNDDNFNIIVKKQHLKILSLLNKITEYEKTLQLDLFDNDDDLILLYK